ncbi:DNA cytosine methyltransferase [Aestuariivivens sediminicola]|uniref:DNA cytosine methyltransferase n=1 Tax=Aestuariivivens sediminicola TaxID=2913560 RepID=UPI001F57EB0B|nr:DNA cytosine methyltransferase [Aestuariivivens sediminicola]
MEKTQGINVLSLFDGISVAQLALNQLNIPINNYYSSEIDKRTIKVTQHHFPSTIQLGDIREIDGHTLPNIDLIIGGSPCQNLSILRRERTGLDSKDSGLLYEAVRLLNEVKPRFFIFENVGSMVKSERKIFDELLGVDGISINSNLVSAQNRHRIYWTNILGIIIPNDRSVILNDIIEDGHVDRDKSNCVLTKNLPQTRCGLKRYLQKSIGQVVFREKSFAELPKLEKLQQIDQMTDIDVKKLFRLMTVTELERLQTLPDGYVDGILRPTACKHAIGNGFTLELIKHILSQVDFGRG